MSAKWRDRQGFREAGRPENQPSHIRDWRPMQILRPGNAWETRAMQCKFYRHRIDPETITCPPCTIGKDEGRFFSHAWLSLRVPQHSA